MRQKRVLSMTAGVLFALMIVLVAAPGFAAPESPILETTFGWQLSDAKIVSAGKTVTNSKGTLTKDHIIEAIAVATGEGTPITKGTFRITLSAFSPKEDMPGQKAGMWYVRGDWKMTDEKAKEKEKEARHSPALINGSLSTALLFNPAVNQGPVEASISIPRGLAAGIWTEALGVFSGNEMFEGTIFMNAIVWPDVAKIKGVKP